MNSMRVLYYIAYYQRMTGSNRSLFELIVHLPPTVQPIVVVAGEGQVAQAYRDAGIEPIVLPPGKFLNQFGKAMLQWSSVQKAWVTIGELLPYTIRVFSLIRQQQPDLIHVNDARGSLLIGAAARLANRPLVGHMRGEMPFSGIPQTLFETLCDRIITVCDAVQSSLKPEARHKAITVYNGIEKVSLTHPPAQLEAIRTEGKLIVCCVASIVPFKGLHHLLDAVAQLNERGWRDRVSFFCVGDFVAEYGDYQQWLMQRQQQLGVDNLIFSGWQSNPFAYYQIADVAVLPSVSQEQLQCDDRLLQVQGNEGFPRTHLEAMLFKLPIVGTEIAGVPEQIINGVNGFVVPPSDAAALADALERLLSDRSLRLKMGQAGYDRVKTHFSTAAYVNGVVEVYQSLVSDRVAEAIESGGNLARFSP